MRRGWSEVRLIKFFIVKDHTLPSSLCPFNPLQSWHFITLFFCGVKHLIRFHVEPLTGNRKGEDAYQVRSGLTDSATHCIITEQIELKVDMLWLDLESADSTSQTWKMKTIFFHLLQWTVPKPICSHASNSWGVPLQPAWVHNWQCEPNKRAHLYNSQNKPKSLSAALTLWTCCLYKHIW